MNGSLQIKVLALGEGLYDFMGPGWNHIVIETFEWVHMCMLAYILGQLSSAEILLMVIDQALLLEYHEEMEEKEDILARKGTLVDQRHTKWYF